MNEAVELRPLGPVAGPEVLAGGPAATAAGGRAAVRLHFAVLTRVEGVAVLGCGWLDDPEGRVARVSLVGDTGQPVDLTDAAILIDSRAARDAMAVPEDIAPRFAFAVALAEPVEWSGGIALCLHFADGTTRPGLAAAAGTVGDLAPVVAAMSVEDGLRFAAGLVRAWRAARPPLRALPQPVQHLLATIHQRIDLARDYGVAASVWEAAGGVDSGLRVDRAGILIKGWFYHAPGDAIGEAAAISLAGRRIALPHPFPRVMRPDLGLRDRAAGFVLFAAAPDLDPDDRFWFLEIGLHSGAVRRLPFLCPPAPPPLGGIEQAFRSVEPLDNNMAQLEGLFRDALAPAVDRFWAGARADRTPPASAEYGKLAEEPVLSIIVPLYGRIDFVRHQIANFSNDPELRNAGTVEIIYVLDDPPQHEAFERLCRDVHAIYGVPFRALSLAGNRGFSGANNAGAAAARGSMLLFLNSDIVPKRPRWAGRLLQIQRSLDGCGILGCRLLLEDGSIQHAGMNFARSLQQPQCWSNEHPGKGLPVGFDPAAGPVPVPAVTGACLLIGRDLFAELGGWPEEYVVGDFEDSDLCLKAWRAGRKVYYTPDVELYHLERQSVKLTGAAGWRQTMRLYNEWRHTRIWGDFIPRLLSELGGRR